MLRDRKVKTWEKKHVETSDQYNILEQQEKMSSVLLDAQDVMHSAADPPRRNWVTVRSLQPSEIIQFKEMAQLIKCHSWKRTTILLHLCPAAWCLCSSDP